MDNSETTTSTGAAPPLRYRLCPRCARAVPASSSERYCVNDGTRLLECCEHCNQPICSPYARFCSGCGQSLSRPGAALASKEKP